MTQSLTFPLSDECICVDEMVFRFSTVHLRFSNEVYLSCTTAVHQPWHFLHSPNTIFHIQGCTVFATYSIVQRLHNAPSAFRPGEVTADCKKQLKFAQKMLKTFYCTSPANQCCWESADVDKCLSDNLTAAGKVAFIGSIKREKIVETFLLHNLSKLSPGVGGGGAVNFVALCQHPHTQWSTVRHNDKAIFLYFQHVCTEQ